MPLPKLSLSPDQAGYTTADADDAVLRAKVSAGPARQRLDMLGAPSMVGVGFSLNRNQFQYWRSFFRTTIAEGSLPFLIDLILDQPDPVEHEARIIPGSVRLSALSGLRYSVAVTMEVKPVGQDSDFDATLVWLYEAYGDDISLTLAALAALVNEHLPA